jgi:hypothetical protein
VSRLDKHIGFEFCLEPLSEIVSLVPRENISLWLLNQGYFQPRFASNLLAAETACVLLLSEENNDAS